MAAAHISYKMRIYPTKEQSTLFHKTFGCCRYIWNRMLADKIAYYDANHNMLQCTPAQYKEECEFLKEVDSLALANVQLNLNAAFRKFFREKHSGFPRFKSKKRSRLSYTTNSQNGSIRITGNYIRLPKVGNVRIRRHRNIPDAHIIRSATISMTPAGRYYVSLLCAYENQVCEHTDTDSAVGLDFSMHGLFVSSDGDCPDMPLYMNIAQERLAKEQHKLSRMYRKGVHEQSHRYYKQKNKVARLHEHVANQRRDYLHKLSRSLVDRYDYICIEDLSVADMMHGMDTSNFSRKITDYGWQTFTSMLQYKAQMYGKHLVKIDRYFPSSQTCHSCGAVNTAVKDLSIREWDCPCCGQHHDRDINAAINIKKEGLRIALL